MNERDRTTTSHGEPPTAGTASNHLLGLERKWWVLIAIGVGSFMSALDGSVVNTVLPLISKALQGDVATVEWVVTVYLLVVSGLLLTFGRIGDMRGHKSVYVWGFAIFVGGSALCGLANSVTALVLARSAQAIGAAIVLSNAPAILTGNFPAAQRGRALGTQATMTYLGLTTGPALGGWLATQFGWRAVFYINVPVGLLAVALCLAFIPRDVPADRTARFDLAGAVTFMGGLVTLLLALNQGHAWGWTSAPILGLLAVTVVLLAAFIAIERRARWPLLDLGLFKIRQFSASTGSAIMNYIGLYSIVFLLPFYLIDGRGLTAAQAGLFLSAQPLVMAVVAPLSGILSDRIGARVPSTLGMLILAGGLFMLSRLAAGTPTVYIPIALAVVGLGIGLFVSPNNSALMGAAPRHRQGVAAGVMATARNVGMVLGIGLAGAIYTTGLVSGNAGAPAAATIAAAVDGGFLAASAVAGIGAVLSALRA